MDGAGHHRLGAGLKRVALAGRDGGGRVVPIEDAEPAQGLEVARRLAKRLLGAGHMAQGRIEDHGIEALVVEGERTPVGLLEGEMR